MKKVIIAFDGKHFSEGAFDFVRYLNEQQPIMLAGVFLPVTDYAELEHTASHFSRLGHEGEFGGSKNGCLNRNIKHFEELCRQDHIEFRVHSGFADHVAAELQMESRYADLLVIGSELFYENLGEDTQLEYIESVLHKTECPVVLIPEKYHTPKNIVLAYDGSESSVFAIKLFAYLFPELQDLETFLIYTNKGKQDLPDRENIQELASRHFNDLVVFKLKLDRGREFEQWLHTKNNAVLVTGAYGRSLLSEMITGSFIKEFIRDSKVPIFIAHK